MRTRFLLTGALVASMLLGVNGTARGQSALDRPPNLTGTWTVLPGTIQFNFIHRFEVSDPPLRKVTNSPTLTLATGLGHRSLVGFAYASNSDLVPAYPNEWEFFGRWMPLTRRAGHPLDVSLQAGYNLAAESIDGEILLARDFGPARILAAGRAFSDGYASKEERFAVAAGGSLRVTDWLALSADYGTLLDRKDDERWTWGAGAQLGVPYTPHSLSIHATNVNTGTLQGTSRGTRTRWGFEYTVPITVGRYVSGFGGSSGESEADDRSDRAAISGREASDLSPRQVAGTDTVRVEIQQLRFGEEKLRVSAGATVTWINRDPVIHTVIADDEEFDSGSIEPGSRWSRTFPEAGTFSYHCTPHPFMTAQVVVE